MLHNSKTFFKLYSSICDRPKQNFSDIKYPNIGKINKFQLLGVYFHVLPSRVGSVLKKSGIEQALMGVHFPVLPSKGLWGSSLKNSLGNILCLKGYIIRVK